MMSLGQSKAFMFQIMLQFRYIIDIGCGVADKTVMFNSEFFTIGVDYKDNVEKARRNHPEITFHEVNMDLGKDLFFFCFFYNLIGV